jgi:hypothetical protein
VMMNGHVSTNIVPITLTILSNEQSASRFIYPLTMRARDSDTDLN